MRKSLKRVDLIHVFILYDNEEYFSFCWLGRIKIPNDKLMKFKNKVRKCVLNIMKFFLIPLNQLFLY